MRKWTFAFQRLLFHPKKVFWLCLAFACMSLVLNGSLLRLWGLHRDHQRLSAEMLSIQAEIGGLSQQLAKARDPSYIERQARDKFDLAGEHDLVFFFSDE